MKDKLKVDMYDVDTVKDFINTARWLRNNQTNNFKPAEVVKRNGLIYIK